MTGGGKNANFLKAVDQFNSEAFKNYNEQALVPCMHCERTFLPDRLDIHAKVCQKVFMRKAVPKNFRVKRMLLPGEVVTAARKHVQIEQQFSSVGDQPQVFGRRAKSLANGY